MSIKIYYAWRFPKNKLNEYIEWAREQMILVVEDMLYKLMGNVPEPDYIPEEIRKNDKKLGYWINGYKFREVFKQVTQAADSPYRDPLVDIECGLDIWLHGRFAYIIATGEYVFAESISNPPSWVSDYAYYNNTDCPAEISIQAWRKRKETWNKLCLNNYNKTRLHHSVVNAKSITDKVYLYHRIVEQNRSNNGR